TRCGCCCNSPVASRGSSRSGSTRHWHRSRSSSDFPGVEYRGICDAPDAMSRLGQTFLLLAVLAAPASAAPSARNTSLGTLPATYAGLLACADCAGIRYQIDLLPRAAFVQRMTYLRNGRDESYYELGAWSLSSDGATLVLDAGRDG